jgi:hypothetical protein
MDYEILTISPPLLPNGIIDTLSVDLREEHERIGQR